MNKLWKEVVLQSEAFVRERPSQVLGTQRMPHKGIACRAGGIGHHIQAALHIWLFEIVFLLGKCLLRYLHSRPSLYASILLCISQGC